MTRIRIGVYGALVLLASGLLGAILLRAGAEPPSRNAAPVSVPVQRVVLQKGAHIQSGYAGLIAARRTSALGFERGGLVVDVTVDVGAHVHKGDVLARLDDRALRADIAAAQAGVRQAEAQRSIAASTLKRQRVLLAKGHISAQRLDEVRANLAASAAAEEVASAQVKTLQARLALSQIIAPYDGVIAERYVDEGAIAAPGKPVLSLVEDGALEVRIGVPAVQLASLHPGELYNFSAASTPFKARLRGFGGQVERATQTDSAVFDIVSSQGALVPGQTARLALPVSLPQAGFWVPLNALREGRRGLWSLYALDQKDGAYVLTPRLVEILYSGADRVYVRGPVKDGTLFLAGGSQLVSVGMRVVPAGMARAGQP